MKFWQLLVTLPLVAIAAVAACNSERGDGSDSNTNWLDCSDDADCSAGTCLCGICTNGCDSSEECAPMRRGAVCFEDVGGASDCRLAVGSSRGACLPACGSDADCPATLECVSGICMPETSSGGSAGNSTGGAGGGGAQSGAGSGGRAGADPGDGGPLASAGATQAPIELVITGGLEPGERPPREGEVLPNDSE